MWNTADKSFSSGEVITRHIRRGIMGSTEPPCVARRTGRWPRVSSYPNRSPGATNIDKRFAIRLRNGRKSAGNIGCIRQTRLQQSQHTTPAIGRDIHRGDDCGTAGSHSFMTLQCELPGTSDPKALATDRAARDPWKSVWGRSLRVTRRRKPRPSKARGLGESP